MEPGKGVLPQRLLHKMGILLRRLLKELFALTAFGVGGQMQGWRQSEMVAANSGAKGEKNEDG